MKNTSGASSVRFLLALCFGIYCLQLPFVSAAGTWIDTFEDDDLLGWTQATTKKDRVGWDAVWESKGGVLQVTVKQPLRGAGKSDLLLLTAFAIALRDFSVRVTPLHGLYSGLALGIRYEESPQYIGKYYFFQSGRITLYYPYRNGSLLTDSVKTIPRIPLGRALEVVFSQGRFQLFSAGRLYAQFFDEELVRIESVGIFCFDSFGDEDEFQLDDFSISAEGLRGLSVSGKNKLATVWGYLKKGD